MTIVTNSSGRRRWVELRTAAGYDSDASVERALDITANQIWRWVVRGREPSLPVLRRLAKLFKVSLDILDETIVSWRKELIQEREPGPEDVE